MAINAGDCLSPAAFATQADSLASTYSSHANFTTQWGLASIDADLAYAHVELLKGSGVDPGAGVTIGFVDSGIDDQHPVFAGKTITEEFRLGAEDEDGTVGLPQGHGTSVASVAAGARIGGATAAHGVAWGADIAMFAVPVISAGNRYEPTSLEGLKGIDPAWGGLFDSVFAWRDGTRRVDILNLSVGFSGIIDGYSEAISARTWLT